MSFLFISGLTAQKQGLVYKMPEAKERIFCNSHFETHRLDADHHETIEMFLAGQLLMNTSEFKRLQLIRSLAGIHYTYVQVHLGIPVFHSQIKINTDTSGNILSWFDRVYLTKVKDQSFPDSNMLLQFIKVNFKESASVHYERVWYAGNEGLEPCYVLISHDSKTAESFETLINGNLEVLLKNDLNRYHFVPKDSIIQAMVFRPDPLTSSSKSYGGNYKDNNDKDPSGMLNAEKKLVNITASFDKDTFRLSGPFAFMKNLSMPDDSVLVSKSNMLNYDRGHPFFEDVNAYYHINTFHNYISGLGYGSLVNYPIEIDTHALMGDDNSMFVNTTTPPQLLFGEGGVDDAEDADVVIHEYGHAISYSASPGSLSGGEREALDEGLGDYLAASYSRANSNFHWEQVFTWDGHNEFWSGRTAVSTKKYPAGLSGEPHDDGQIWASAMMSVWDKIGRKNTDKLMLESLYSFASDMSMCDAARLVLQSDSLLNKYENYAPIYTSMDAYNLFYCFNKNSGNSIREIDNNELGIYNSDGFRSGSSDLHIKWNGPLTPPNCHISISNLTGSVIRNYNDVDLHDFSLSPTSLPAGFYVMRISTSLHTYAYKLLRN